MEDAKFATKVLPLRRSLSPCVRAAGGGGRFDRFWLTWADKAGNQFGAGGRGRGGGRARGGTGVVQARRVTCCPTKVTEINRICPFFFFSPFHVCDWKRGKEQSRPFPLPKTDSRVFVCLSQFLICLFVCVPTYICIVRSGWPLLTTSW